MTPNSLEIGREAYARNAWSEAYEHLSTADHQSPLAPRDLELLATAAILSGRDAEGVAVRERAHAGYLEAEDVEGAARVAIWIGLTFMQEGEFARGGGWIAKAQRLLTEPPRDCVEIGYLMLPQGLQAMGSSQKPKIPAFAGQLDPKVVQLHSTDYRNLSQLQPGPVLIVGAGNSGADIGLEVAGKHPTIWSGKESAVVPFRMETLIARYLLTRIVRFVGMRVMSLKTPIGRKLRPKMMQMPAPLVRVKPKDLVNLGVRRVGRIVSVKDGLPVTEDGERLEVSNVI